MTEDLIFISPSGPSLPAEQQLACRLAEIIFGLKRQPGCSAADALKAIRDPALAAGLLRAGKFVHAVAVSAVNEALAQGVP